MESLIKIDGEPLAKLIDVVTNAIGKWYEPRHVVRMASAEAKAEHIKTIEKVKREALLNHNEDLYNHLSAVEKRLITKESKRQQNIEQVVNCAANVLSLETEVSSENVDPDWITRFFDIAQDISNEQMQELWGRVLAGEVKQPGAFSLRTLEALRNITSEEAQLFEEVASYAIYQGSYFLYNGFSGLEKTGIEYWKIMRLIEIGIIQSVSDAALIYYREKTQRYAFLYGDYVYFINFGSLKEEIRIPIYSFSVLGGELFKLVSIKPDYNFVKSIMKDIVSRNKGTTVSFAKITKKEGSRVECDENTLDDLFS